VGTMDDVHSAAAAKDRPPFQGEALGVTGANPRTGEPDDHTVRHNSTGFHDRGVAVVHGAAAVARRSAFRVLILTNERPTAQLAPSNTATRTDQVMTAFCQATQEKNKRPIFHVSGRFWAREPSLVTSATRRKAVAAFAASTTSCPPHFTGERSRVAWRAETDRIRAFGGSAKRTTGAPPVRVGATLGVVEFGFRRVRVVLLCLAPKRARWRREENTHGGLRDAERSHGRAAGGALAGEG
jgi:hypothetical protein